MVGFIERHREVSRRVTGFPCGNDFAFVAINHRHMSGVGNIYKNSFPAFLQLESFGMSCESDPGDLLAVRRVDDADSAAAKANVNLFGGSVVTNIVSIIFEVEFSNRLVRFSVVNLENTAFVICNKEAV